MSFSVRVKFIHLQLNAVKEQRYLENAETVDSEAKVIQSLEDHGGAVNGVSFHGNNLIASGSG